MVVKVKEYFEKTRHIKNNKKKRQIKEVHSARAKKCEIP